MASNLSPEEVAVTSEMLLSSSGEFDIESIEILYLDHKNIADLASLCYCKNLCRINLSHNQISVISALRNLKQLTFLNISSNYVTNIDSLSGLENLEDLNAAGNLIGNSDRLRCLSSISSLRKLRLHDGIKKLTNPVCDSEGYHKAALAMLPQLMMLDGERVKGRGSDFHRICQDLDDQLKSGRTFGPVVERPLPGPWFDSDQLSTPDLRNTSSYDVMEFQKVLRECKKTDEKASAMLDQFKSRLQPSYS